jgi:predicted nucleic acid-binding protein
VIGYFDTSALIPLIVAEPGSERAARLWEAADRVASVRLVYPEGRAALAQAYRMGRLTGRQLREAVRRLDVQFQQLDVVELDDGLARRAGELAEAHGLRAYDAVHLAAADRIRDPEFVLVAGDEALLRAAQAEGLAIARV